MRELFREPDVRHFEGHAVQALQSTGIGREVEHSLVGVQELFPTSPLFAVVLVVAVLAVAHQRAADAGKVRADLMRPSGQEFHFHEGHVLRGLEDPVLRLDGLGARSGVFVDIDPVLLLVLPQIAFEDPCGRLRRAVDGTQVELVDLPVLHLLVQDTQRLGGLGRQDDAAGVPVDAVDERRCKGLLRVRVVLPFFIEVPFDPADEGVDIFPVVGMCQQADRLV